MTHELEEPQPDAQEEEEEHLVVKEGAEAEREEGLDGMQDMPMVSLAAAAAGATVSAT